MTTQEIIYKRLGKIAMLKVVCKKHWSKYSEGVWDSLKDEEATLNEILSNK